jgi:hypothetical protein
MDLVLLTLRLWSFLASGTVIWRDRKASSVPYRGSRKVFWPTEHLVHFIIIVLLFSHAVKCPFIRIFPILYQSLKFFFISVISLLYPLRTSLWWLQGGRPSDELFFLLPLTIDFVTSTINYIYYIEFTKSRNQWICITHNYKPYSTSM